MLKSRLRRDPAALERGANGIEESASVFFQFFSVAKLKVCVYMCVEVGWDHRRRTCRTSRRPTPLVRDARVYTFEPSSSISNSSPSNVHRSRVESRRWRWEACALAFVGSGAEGDEETVVHELVPPTAPRARRAEPRVELGGRARRARSRHRSVCRHHAGEGTHEVGGDGEGRVADAIGVILLPGRIHHARLGRHVRAHANDCGAEDVVGRRHLLQRGPSGGAR